MTQRFTETQSLRRINYIMIPFYLGITVMMMLDKASPKGEIITAFLVESAVMIPLILLFFTTKLRTEVTANQIVFEYRPLVKKKVYTTADIASATVIKYRFVGGWGVRFLTRYGTVYNAWGNKGLQIVLKNGKKLVIGTQRPEELRAFLESSTTFGE